MKIFFKEKRYERHNIDTEKDRKVESSLKTI